MMILCLIKMNFKKKQEMKFYLPIKMLAPLMIFLIPILEFRLGSIYNHYNRIFTFANKEVQASENKKYKNNDCQTIVNSENKET